MSQVPRRSDQGQVDRQSGTRVTEPNRTTLSSHIPRNLPCRAPNPSFLSVSPDIPGGPLAKGSARCGGAGGGAPPPGVPLQRQDSRRDGTGTTHLVGGGFRGCERERERERDLSSAGTPAPTPPLPRISDEAGEGNESLRNSLNVTLWSISGSRTTGGGPEMWQVGVLQFRVLLLLLAQLTLPGYGNEGSNVGSCHCNKRFSSRPTDQQLKYYRKYLEAYQICFPVTRFQINTGKPQSHHWTVCGHSKASWILDLKGCFDQGECGFAHSQNLARQEYLLHSRTHVPQPTERAPLNISTPVQTKLAPTPQSTLQINLLVGTLSYGNENINFTVWKLGISNHSLEARDKQKQGQENVHFTAGKSLLVAVPSLLVITFIVIIILTYVLCKRRQQPPQNSSDLQPEYTPVVPDSNA